MKKKLLFLALLYSGYSFAKEPENQKKALSAQDLADHGKKWAKQTVQKLNKEELALLANYLYFNFIQIRYEYMIRTSLLTCQSNLSALQFLVNNRPEETNKNAETLIQRLSALIQEAIPARAYATKAAQACFEHIEDSDFEELKKVIVKFQSYSTSALNQFIQQDWPKAITKLFSDCAQNMKNEAEKLTMCQNELKLKANLEIDDIDDLDAISNNFNQAINAADASYSSYLVLLTHTLNVKSMSADILNITALINNIFYNHLFESMKTKKMSLFPIMFDENGYIEEDDQDENLPPLDDKFTIDKKHFIKE